MTCLTCQGRIEYLDPGQGHGGWWAHETHPDDGHDAVSSVVKCAWSGCTKDADPAREGSGPFDGDLCTYHDEIQPGDPPFNDTTKENA